MTARVAQRKTKRIPSAPRTASRKPPIPAAKLAQRLAEVQALRKLVRQAEAARAC